MSHITTSFARPATESTNRYDVLRADANEFPLDDGAADPRNAQPAKRPPSSSSRVNGSNDKSPTIVTPTATVGRRRLNVRDTPRLGGAEIRVIPSSDKATPNSGRVPPQHDSRGAGPERGNTAKPPRNDKGCAGPITAQEFTATEAPKVTRVPKGLGGQSRIPGKSDSSVRGRPIDVRIGPPRESTSCLAQGGQERIRSPHPDPDQDPSKCTLSGYDPQRTRMAEREESAGAQAVKRGHKVQLEEVPDEEDNTSYRQWEAKGSLIVSTGTP